MTDDHDAGSTLGGEPDRHPTLEQELDRVIGPHEPSDDAAARHEAIREAARLFLRAIAHIVPHSTERSVAVSKAQEALFWSNAAIARNPFYEADDGDEEEASEGTSGSGS